MPVYQYEGVHYDLPDGLTNEQAIAKIETHLGKSSGPSFLDNLEQKGKQLASDAWDNTKDTLGEIGKTILNSKGIGLDKPSATTENIGNLATSMGGMAAGVPVAGMKAINNVSQGQPADFEKNYAAAIDRLTFKPKSELGQEQQEGIGEFFNRNIIPLAPMFGEFMGANEAQHGASIQKAMRSSEVPVPKNGKGLDVNQAIQETVAPKKDGGLSAGGSISTPSLPDVMPPQRLPMDNEPTSVMDNMVQRLQGEQLSPLRSQMELPFEQRDDLALEQQPGLQPAPPKPMMDGTQADMVGPDLTLKNEGEMAPGIQRPATGGEQGELPVTEPQLKLESEGEMAPQPKPEPIRGEQQDMIGPDLTLDPNAAMPELPADSIIRQSKVQADPRVVDAMQRVADAASTYLKAHDEFNAGRLSKDMLDKLGKTYQALEDAHQYITARVADELRVNERKAREVKADGPLSRQRGAVDIGPLKQLVDKAIEKLKEFDLPVVREAVEKFNITNNPKAFADALRSTKADGMNGELSKALQDAYTAASNKTVGEMQNLMEKKAATKPRGPKPGKSSPGGKQSGYILLEGKKERALQNLVSKTDIELKLKEQAPSQWTKEQALEEIKKAQDVDQNTFQRAVNYLTKGGQYMALKLHNPLYRYVFEKFIEADRLARADIADWLHNKDTGLGALERRLNDKDFTDSAMLINAADLNQKPIDQVRMAELGATKDQLAMIQRHREAMDYALQMINKARAAAGKEPISPRIAYAAMQASGDFRRLVYTEKGGKIVGVISSDFRGRLNRLKGTMEEKGYHVGEERYFGGNQRQRGDANDAFMRAAESLAENDPKIADFVEVLNQVRATEISSFLNMKKHTMAKKGVFGMEGRKDWQTNYQNAKDFFKTQNNYMEAAIKWGHLSEAFKDAKDVMKSDEASHMPVAKDLAQRYMYSALGFNPSAIGRSFNDAVATAFDHMGVGYSVARKTMAMARQYTNASLLMLRPSFWYQNIVQPLMAMPGMKADLIARGLDAGFDFGTGASYVAQGLHTAMRLKSDGVTLTPLEQAASRYARTHHVYGSDLVEHSNHVRKGVGYYAEQVSTFASGKIESATRQAMFYAFVHMLDENGMTVRNGLLEAAHNLTDISMNNYSAMERPQLYNTLGPAGDLAVNLQSYKHNELSRVAMFVRDSKDYKSIRPIAADMMARFAAGGVMGLIGYEEVDGLVHLASKFLGHPISLSNLIYGASEHLNRMVYDKTGGAVDAPYALSNGVHSLMGLDLSRSLGLTSVIPNSPLDALFPGGSKMWEGAKAAGTLAMHPSEMNAKRAALANAPLFAQGALNNAWFTKGTGDNRVAVRPSDLKAQAYRNNSDYVKKEFGFTGINESVQRQKIYNVETINRDYADLRQGPLNAIRDSLFTGGKIDPKAITAYVNYRGNPKTLEGDIARYAQQQNLTPEEIAYLQAKSSSAVGALLKARDYAKAFAK